MSGTVDRAGYDDERFMEALHALLGSEKRDYPSHIGGMKVASGRDFEVRSPIDSTISFGRFQDPDAGTAGFAVEAAAAAYASWSSTPASERAACFARALDAVRAQRYRLAAAVLLSTGMTKRESVREADRLASVLSECVAGAQGAGKPTGVWGIATSHESPLASPAGYAAAAAIAGNAAVVAPSDACPLPAFMAYSIFEKAGLPGGVVNVVVDARGEACAELSRDDRLSGIVASGSGDRLADMMFLQVDDEMRFVNEVKGMSPILVHKPSDAAKAAEGVLESAFSCSGQRLYSASKVVVTAGDQKKFVEALSDRAGKIVVGDPADDGVLAGPLISGDRMDRLLSFADRMRGRIMSGGKRVTGEFMQNGLYAAPAIAFGSDGDESYVDQGIPVLFVTVSDDLDSAIEEMQETEKGLSAGMFSRDREAAKRLREEVDAPFHHVNESSLALEPAAYAKVETFTKGRRS
ncbi:MAG: aldehyde dehydrogenase family protein [Candidatus Methanoplasma sp.]|jgi:acyl-CoA reductase-like NAD-dependent aldehyde dehydrogenase|nr:aldehyde dehydrogenase family protein [Candidatus Methanoplasma sp.]